MKPLIIEEKLPAEFKQKWIEALRSGEYQQGSRRLRYGDSYCCLGVACLVVGIEPDASPYIQKEIVDGNPEEELLYQRIPEMITGENEITCRLSAMNDEIKTNNHTEEMVHKFTFQQIADWVEQNL